MSYTARATREYCAKGSRIGVRGQLQYRQWQDDEGGNHSTVEIRARELELLSGKNGKPAATEEENPPPPVRTMRFHSESGMRYGIDQKRRQPREDQGCLLVCAFGLNPCGARALFRERRGVQTELHVASTTGRMLRRTFSILTMPYRAIVLSVRERLLLLCSVRLPLPVP